MLGRRNPLTALVFFVAPAVLYLGFVSHFSFNPFGEAYGWQAYNYYALALSNLTHAIPADAISAEGQYYGGRVYMYYGMLPAVLRLPLVPFVDLERVPLAILYIWGMVVAGQFALQRAVLMVYRARAAQRAPHDLLLLLLISYAIWFASGGFLLAQDNSFYHEPHAAALMLTSIFIAMLVRDLLIVGRPPSIRRLAVYALLAGLALFARQTFAIGLYLATLALLLPERRALRENARAALMSALRRSVVPLAILFAAGLAYLALGYSRTGTVGSGMTIYNYGYYIVGKNRPRLETMIDQQFDIVRIIPNSIYVLVGGKGFRSETIEALGGGITLAFGRPLFYLFFTPFALVTAGLGLFYLYRRVRAAGPLDPVLLVAIGFLATALVQMAYTTMQYRYTAELWPLFLWLMFLALRDFDPAVVPERRSTAFSGALVALTAVSLVYTASARHTLTMDSPIGKGSLREPLPPELAALATAPGSRAPSIVPFRDERSLIKPEF